MIAVVYPGSINWFYRTQAEAMAADLTEVGLPARAIASNRPADLEACGREVVLLVAFAEAVVSAERQGGAGQLLDALQRIDRRILVNFDSVRSTWFTRHFEHRPRFFSDVFDFGFYRQTTQPTVLDVPYSFVPESLGRAERAALSPWCAGRVVPWAVLGHATRDRSALIEAILRCLPKHGFVFSPPLRPFTERSGLNRAAIMRLLGQTDLYIWGSHHLSPYHETQRVLHAVLAGAVPVKIDPLYSHRMRLPWVYPSLAAMLRAKEKHGLAGLYDQARRHVDDQGRLGDNLRGALARVGAAPAATPVRTDAA